MSLRIVHTSDWHLGKILFGRRLTQEQCLYFEKEFFPFLREAKPDVLLITGDIFDRPNPDLETQNLFVSILKKFLDLKIPAIIIPGNHDSKRLTLFKDFLCHLNIMLVDDLSQFYKPLVFGEKELYYFYIFPYLSFYELKNHLEEMFPSRIKNLGEEITYSKLFSFAVSQLGEIKHPSFFLGHFAVEKAFFSGEETTMKGIGSEEVLPLSSLLPFDMAFLGHLHRLQKINKVYYSGSILPYSFSEAKNPKGVWFIECRGGKIIREEKVHLHSTFELITLKGKFEEVLKEPATEAFVRVILEEDMPVFNAYERLKERFPNLVILEYEKELKEKDIIQEEGLIKEEILLDEKELFREFYKLVEGKEPAPEVWKVYLDVVEELKKLKEVELCQ